MLTGLIQDHNFQQLVQNLSLVEDEDRFYNWYHGRSQLWIPYWGQAGGHSLQYSRFNDTIFTHAGWGV